MTFPSTAKKSSSVKSTSKTGSESKALGSPGSPKIIGSLNIPAKMISPRTSVKTMLVNKATEQIKDEFPVKSLTSKSIIKPVIDVKSKPVGSSVIKVEKKSVTKPPPLKLNIKSTDTKGLQSTVNPKSVSKTPMVTKPLSAAKSPSISPGIVKPSTSPITKSPLMLTTSKTLTVPKSPLSTKPSTPTVKSIVPESFIKDNPKSLKSVSTLDQTSIVKSSTQSKKVAVTFTNSAAGIKSPTTLTSKSSTISRSPSITSSIKSTSLKVPISPSNPSTKQLGTSKISPSLKSTVSNKPGIVSKLEPTCPKVMVKKDSSTLSLLSVKSSSTIKSTLSIVPKKNSKDLVPKSPIGKTQSLAVKALLSPKMKTTSLSIVKTNTASFPTIKTKTPSSPTVKTPSSQTVKTPSSSTVKTPSSPTIKTKTSSSPTIKTKISLSPIVKTRSLSLSANIPLSPVTKKMLPTKLILSPGLTKNQSLSSAKLNSVSTDSLASRTSLKSPMSPKPIKVVLKKNLIDIQNAEERKSKGIQGKKAVTKITDIPGIIELPSNLVFNKLETEDVECRLENTTENIPKEEIEMEIIQIPEQDALYSEELKTHLNVISIDNSLEIANNLVNEGITSLNVTNTQNIVQLQDVQGHNLKTIYENSIEPSSITSLEEIKENDSCNSLDFEIVEKSECIPCLNTISQSVSNFNNTFDDNHFELTTNEYVTVEQLNKVQLCTADVDDNFEPMNDKLVLGDVPFETDSSDISDNEQSDQNEILSTQNDIDDDVFSSNEDNLPILNKEDLTIHDRADRREIDNEHYPLIPKSVILSEGESSISTDDGQLSRKSYSEAVSGSPKYNESFFNYDFEVADDCLDYEDEVRSVFVEVTEKEFPELKSDKRKRNKKQKKRNYSNRTESLSGKYNLLLTINKCFKNL